MVTVNGSQITSTTLVVQFELAPGNYSYAIGLVGRGFQPDAASGSVLVVDVPVNLTVVWSQIFSLTFSESNLPSGAMWHSYLGLFEKAVPAGSEMLWRVPNGTYSYNVGSNSLWTPSPQNGQTTINGSNATVHIVFSPPPPRFYINFTETGLPNGTNWFAVVNGAGGGSGVPAPAIVSYLEQNGTYVWSVGADGGYEANHSADTLVLSGANVVVPVTFALPVVPMAVFHDTGAYHGAWNVTVDGSLTLSDDAGGDLAFSVPAGTHNYSVQPGPTAVASPGTGSFILGGTSIEIDIVLTSTRFVVTFVEYGVAAGDWWVNLSGINQTGSAGAAISSVVGAGWYVYQAGAPGGYLSTDAIGTFHVEGGGVTLTVTFTNASRAPPSSGTSGGGFSTLEWAALGLGGVAVVLAVVIAGRRRPPRRTDASRPSSGSRPGGSA